MQRPRISVLPFEEAREFVRSLKLKNTREWWKYSASGQLPLFITTSPHRLYKNKGWKDWGDWLGTLNKGNKKIGQSFLPFKEARDFVRKLNLNSQQEWQAYSKSGQRPPTIPADPRMTYINEGWNGHADWMGYSSGRKRRRPKKENKERI